MTTPTISELPVLPTFPAGPGLPDQPREFFTKFLAFLEALRTYRTEANALAAYLESLEGGGGGGDMLAANNLSEIISATTALTNLGLSANGKSLVTAANYAAMKALLDLEIGTDVQAYNATLAALAGLSLSQGDILYRDASGLQRLAAGTSGQFLKTNGAGANPAWVDGDGAMELIATQTPSGVASVTFSSIPGTYSDLRLVVRGRSTAVALSVSINLRFNGDTGSNYDNHFLQTNNATTTAFAQLATVNYLGNLPAASATSGFAASSVADITQYAGTAFQKEGHYYSGMKRTNSAAEFFTERGSFWWRNAAAITQIQVSLGSGNFVSGSSVSLYGIK